ncbi:MAG: DUF2807 domain-containing protein [Paludibacter sp.]|nr:DUF2807 domain-containing protein [Paludibacter sp.]
MKKTLTINLNGRVFNIDEDAYALLENYLKNLKTYFSRQEDSGEIMSDFEARIGEIFSAKLTQGYDVINIDGVEQLIVQMGRPSDFDDSQEKESTFEQFASSQSTNANENTSTKQRKQFFRDPRNKMLGGVCSGAAAYLGWDVTWVRLAVVALFFITIPIFSWIVTPGWIFILYIALWIIVPEAKTAEDRLKMTGESVTLENIGKTVAADANQENNLQEKSNNSGCISAFLKICLVCLGIVVIPIIVIVIIVLIAVLLGVGTGILGGVIPFSNDTFLFVQHPAIATIGLCLLIGIPLMAFLYWICQKIFHWGKVNKAVKIITLVVWFASIVALSFAGWKADWQQVRDNWNTNNFSKWQLDKKNISGNGSFTERTFNFSENVNKIILENNLNVDLQIDSIKSEGTELVVKTDFNIIGLLDINARGTTLTLKPQRRYNLIPSAPIVIKLKINELKNLELTGASTLNISNAFNINDLDIDISGASDLKIANLTANKIECETSGASDAIFSGAAQYFNAIASGASSIKADNLTAENVDVHASGASKIQCFVINSLTAESSGASSIIYSGSPKAVSKDTSGAGKVVEK